MNLTKTKHTYQASYKPIVFMTKPNPAFLPRFILVLQVLSIDWPLLEDIKWLAIRSERFSQWFMVGFVSLTILSLLVSTTVQAWSKVAHTRPCVVHQEATP